MTSKLIAYIVKYLDSPDTLLLASKSIELFSKNNIEYVLTNMDYFLTILKKYNYHDNILKAVVSTLPNNIEKLNKYFPEIFQ